MPGPQRRLLVRAGQMMTLRLETLPGFRSGSRLTSFAVVEWAGRVGHPSSYALLGGSKSDKAGVALSVTDSAQAFREALAAPTDSVQWGLPPEYEKAIVTALAEQPLPVLVSRSAHSKVGSSSLAFGAVAVLLSQILAWGVPDDDDAVWRQWDRCWNIAASSV